MFGAHPRTTSLRKSLYTSFVLLFLYVLMVIIASILINLSIQKRFVAMAERNDRFASLLTTQTQLQESFQEALRATDSADRDRWFTINRRMEELLQEISEKGGLTRPGNIHLRVIGNMYRYQLYSGGHMVFTESLSPTDYQEISFLSQLLGHMNQETQQLAITEYRATMDGFSEYFDRFKRQESIAMIALALFVLVFGFLAIRSINRVLASANGLIQATTTFDNGTIDEEDFPPTGIRELDSIASSFNSMKHEIHRYIDELKEKSELEMELQKEHLQNEQMDRRLKQAQLDFLRSQINPHFLFNTLNIIGKSSVLQDTTKSLELIEAISLIMRYTLEHSEDLVTLDEELEIIRAYLFIQQARFTSRLEYKIRVDPDAGEVHIPPVILQPLIENSIKYGLENNSQALKIEVSAHGTPTGIDITVLDNGHTGDDAGRAPLPGMGIGLHNLKRRLALRYGRDDLIDMSYRKESGMKVTIHLPVPQEMDA